MGLYDEEADPPSVAPASPAFGLASDPAHADRLKAAVTGTTTPPATAQRVLSLQLKTGLPSELIERNLDAIEQQATAADFDPIAFRKTSPLLATWLEQHPLHGPAAQNDLVPLTAMERTLQIAKHSARTGAAALYQHADLGAWSGMELLGDLFVAVNPGSGLGYWLRDTGKAANARAEKVAGRLQGPAPIAPGFLEQTAYSAAESIGMSIPTIASSVLLGGGPAAEKLSLAMMGTQTGLPAYSQARQAGKGVAESAAFGAAQGIVEAWTEALPLHTLLGDLHAKAGLLKTVVHQMLPEVAGEEIATALQDLNEWATLHPDRPFSDYVKARPEAFVQTALATILATGAQTGALHTLARVAGGLASAPTVAHLGDQVKQTGLASTAPAAFEDFIRHATADGGDTVHAPLDTWDTYWQERGVDPAAKAVEVTGSPDAYRAAVSEGRDLAIPTARYLSQIAGTEHNTFFQNEIRLDVDVLNTREAQEALDRFGHATPPGTAVDDAQHAALVATLTEGGKFTADQADAQARLVEAVVGTLATRKGEHPSTAAAALLDRLGVTRPDLATGATPTAVTEFGQPGGKPPREDPAAIARLTDTDPAIAASDLATLGLPDLRQQDTGAPKGTEERRGVVTSPPPTGSIAERVAAMRAENPEIERQASELRARDFAARNPRAVFLGYGPDGPLYNVVGGPFDKSTKSEKGLQDLGIPIPETPADTGERLNGAQLREIALKARGQGTLATEQQNPAAPPVIPAPGSTTLYQTAPVVTPAQTFYSRIRRSVEESKQAAATGQQWKATIKNSKLGVNADEFALTRVQDLEDGQRYTKQEVLDYLAGNEIQIDDVTLGENGSDEDYDSKVDDLTDEIFDRMIDEETSSILDDYESNVGESRAREEELEDDNGDPSGESVWWAYVGNDQIGGEAYDTEKEALDAAEEERDRRADQERNDEWEAARERAEENVDRAEARQQALNQLGEPDTRTRYGTYSLPGGNTGSYREIFLTLPGDRVGERPENFKRGALEIVRRLTSMHEGTVTLRYEGRLLGTFRDDPILGYAVRTLDAHGDPIRTPGAETHDQGIEVPAEWFDRGRPQDPTPNGREALDKANRRADQLMEAADADGVLRDAEGRTYTVEVRAEYRQRTDQHWQDIAEGLAIKQLQASARQLAPEGWVDGHDEYEGIENPIVRLRLNTRVTTEGAPILFLEEVQTPHDDEFAKMPELFRKNWRSIAFKWALRYAVDHDLTAVAWTTGAQQAQRYSLETHVKQIAWARTQAEHPHYDQGARVWVQVDQFNGGGMALYVDPDQKVIGVSPSNRGEQLVGQKLGNVLGDELAARMMSEPEGTALPADLRVGGVGLKRLYDVDFVNVVNGLPAVKRTGGRVGTVPITLPTEKLALRFVGTPLTRDEVVARYKEQEALAGEGEPHQQGDYRRTLANMSYAMDRGSTFEDALLNYGTSATATRLGGALVQQGPQVHQQPAVVITPEMRASILGGQPLFQEGPAGGAAPERKGYIQFGPGDRINVGLLPAADLSTFLHETGHLFLKLFDETATELRGRDAGSLTVDQQRLLADHQTLMTWLKVEPGGVLTTAQHEQMAEGFIDYLHRGEAPSLELQSIFSTFRAWLIGVYRSLTRLHVSLTPEVRGVFDRLLASDQAIAEAERARGAGVLFATAADMGVTPAEFALYEKGVAQSAAAARAELDARLVAEVERERTALWTAQRKAIRDDVTQAINERPEYRALAALQYGTQPDGSPIPGVRHDGPLKLSKDRLVQKLGEPALRAVQRLRPHVYQLAEGGLDPDYVAELVGFTSGDAMIRAISQAPKRRVAIENETNARMLEAHGSLQLDGTLPAVAQAATANTYHDQVLRQELAALNKLRKTVSPFVRLQQAITAGAKQEEIDALEKEVSALKAKTRGGAATIRGALPAESVVRQLARDRIGALPIRQIQAQTFWATARRASQRAVETAARQDFDGAIVAKQQEILNLAMYRQAVRVQEEIQTRVAFAKSLDTIASRRRIGLAGGSYQDQIDGVLDRFEFAKVSQRALDRRTNLAKWAAGLEASGQPVDLPAGLLDEARRVNYQQLSVDEFMGVTDGLAHLAHLAGLKNGLLAAADQRDFAGVRDQVADSIRALNPKRPTVLEFRPAQSKWRTAGDYIASTTKIATIVQSLDGHVDGGPFWEAFMRPINAAGDAEVIRKGQVGADYVALMDAHYPDRTLWDLNQLHHVPALNASISKEFAIAVAQNWGNAQGRERLLNDPVRHFDEGQIAAVLDLLDENDWTFVQGHWDFLDRFWPEIAAKMKRVTGVEPVKVEPLAVRTKFGEFRGGYHPLAYDGRLSPRASQFAAAQTGTLQTAAAYIRTTTARGHEQTRQDHVGLPVRLDMSVAYSHLDQVVHDLTHHEMLIDATRLLRDSKVAKAIYETQGDQVYGQLKNALEDIARGSLAAPGQPTMMDKGATWMRQRTQLAMLAYNLWTAVQQPLGVFNGMDRVGVRWVAKGMTRWLRDAASMENTAHWIADVSPMMRERVTTATQDLHDLRGALQHPGGWFDRLVRTVTSDHLTQAALTDSYLWHIGVAQRIADIPTWLGMYEKQMASDREGRTGEAHEARAIAIADQAVLDSQGGGQIKDLAKVQRGGPVARAFMTFASYGVTTFNAAKRNLDIARRGDFASPATTLRLLGHLGLIYTMPALATVAMKHAFGRGGADDDPTNWLTQIGGEMLSSAMSGLIYIREGANALQTLFGLDTGARGYSGPAALRPIQVAYDLAQQVRQGDLDKALWHSANQAAGFLFAYPAAQVQKTVDGAIALYEGRTSNPAALLFGPPPKAQ